MHLHGLNVFAVLVSWLINMGIGAYWYSPAGFGKLWSKLSGVDMMKMPKDEANQAIIVVAVGALVQTLALATILHALHPASLMSGLTAGLVLWAGFTAATTLGTTLYSRRSFKYWWLNASFFLLVMAINSLLLTAWK